MDHSLQGYLERRTTKELMGVLRGFKENGDEQWDAEVVLMIIEILKKRMEAGENLEV